MTQEELRRLIAFCDQVARDGVLPSRAWFTETAAALRGFLEEPEPLQLGGLHRIVDPGMSAQPCGCDPGANWKCEVHR